MNIFNMIPGISGIQDKAADILSGFLDRLLEEHKPLLRKENGEVQIFYIMFPKKNEDKTKYMIAIVALDENDTIIRFLKTIALEDALQTIFSQM